MRRVVGQRFDLLTRQRRSERWTARIRCGLLLVLCHGHGCFHFLNRQHRDLLVLATSDTDVFQQPRLEAGELGLDRVPARHQARNGGDACVGRPDWRDRCGARGVLRAGDCHRGADDDGAAWVDYSHAQRADIGGLRERARS